MTTPTQAQKNRMIYNRTLRNRMGIADATELLDVLINDITDMEDLADHLRFHKFITNQDAIKLAKGQGWTVEELPAAEWERWNNVTGRFASKAAN